MKKKKFKIGKHKKTQLEADLYQMLEYLVKIVKKKHGTNAKIEVIEKRVAEKQLDILVDPSLQAIVPRIKVTLNGHLEI